MRFVIRDFSTVHGVGFAVVHIDGSSFTGHDSTCDVLRRYTARGEAYQLDDGSGLDGSEYDYRETTVEAAEAAHRRRFEVTFPMRRHECVARHQQWLAGLVTEQQLAAELGVDQAGWDDLWARVEAANPDHPLFTQHQRDGHWLLEPGIADLIRRHAADHPDEYSSRPAPAATVEVPLQVKDLREGDLIKSYVDFVPDMRVTRRPLPGQYGWYDYETSHGTHRARGTDTVTALISGCDDRARRAMEGDPAAAGAAAAGTTPAGETTNLTASIEFAEASSSSARDVASRVQAVTASLTAGGVSGEPLRLAATAMELAEQLGTTFDDLAAELRRHTVVAEAYAAVGDDAGDKQFNQAT